MGLESAEEERVDLGLALFQFSEGFLEFLEGLGDAVLEGAQLLAVNSAARIGLFLELLVLLQDEPGPLLKQLDVLLFILHQPLQLLLAVLRAPADPLQRLLLPLHDGEAQLLRLHEVWPEVLPEPLLEAVNPVICEDVFLDVPVALLQGRVVLALEGQLSYQQALDLEDLVSCLEFLAADAHAPVVEELVV